LLETARAMQFKKPKGRGDADFTIPLDFTSGRARVVWLDEEEAEVQIKPYVDELGGCADESGVSDPSNVRVTMYVGPRGKVKSVGYASRDEGALDEAWAACAEQHALAWQLVDPRGKIAKLAFVYNQR
jgi:hypothetical protein